MNTFNGAQTRERYMCDPAFLGDLGLIILLFPCTHACRLSRNLQTMWAVVVVADKERKRRQRSNSCALNLHFAAVLRAHASPARARQLSARKNAPDRSSAAGWLAATLLPAGHVTRPGLAHKFLNRSSMELLTDSTSCHSCPAYA